MARIEVSDTTLRDGAKARLQWPQGQAASFPISYGPTPIQMVEQHGSCNVFLKRDDLIDDLGWGHKLRKLNYVFSSALQGGITHVVLDGQLQSNCCACASIYGPGFGLIVDLILRAKPPTYVTGNHALMVEAGGLIKFIGERGDGEDAKRHRAAEIHRDGGRPLVLPTGMSTPEALNAGIELAREVVAYQSDQGFAFDALVVPVGTGGTVLGIEVGRMLLGQRWRVVGICIDDLSPTSYISQFRKAYSAFRSRAYPELPIKLTNPELVWPVDHAGYKIQTPEANAEAARMASYHGIALDPTYMAKAWAGALNWLDAHQAVTNALVVHTGGNLHSNSTLRPANERDQHNLD
jgi:1-aminocyclopropane-1-carboxylate deaminase/D-cysteine desulfhydrase-like pyridoxal-dependent ACC family enzyme